MERRCHPRVQLVRNALLYHPHGYLCPCLVENATPNGLFVRLADVRIHKGCCVDVVIDASPYSIKPIKATGLVVYKWNGGIGLFCQSDIPLNQLFGAP